MKVPLSDRLVAALRTEYPRCLTDSEAVGQMVESIVWQHLAANGRTRHTLAEYPPDPIVDEATACV